MIINRIVLLMFAFISVVLGAQPEIEFYKTASPQYVEGDRTITYRLTIINGSKDDLNLTLADDMEDGLFTDADIDDSSIDSNISCKVDTSNTSAELTCTDIIVPAGASKQMLYTVIAPDEQMLIENNATLKSNGVTYEASVTVTVFPAYTEKDYQRDLCYIAPDIPEDPVCYRSGAFFYGPDCTASVVIRQDSDRNLTNVHVFKAYTSSTTYDNCYTQEGGTCIGNEDLAPPLLHEGANSFFENTFAVAHDFSLGNLVGDENRTIVDINTVPVSVSKQDPTTSFQYIALIGQYEYEEDNGSSVTATEYIYPCDAIYSGAYLAQATAGGINDVNLSNVDITANDAASYIAYETYSKVGTKIVNQPFILGVTYLDGDGNPATYDGRFGETNNIINAPVILQYKASEATEWKPLWAGEFPHDKDHILTIESNLNDGVDQNAYPVIKEAFRAGQIKIELIDYGGFFRAISGLKCGASSLESGLCLVPACLNSAEQILGVFPLETYPHTATCVYGDGGGAAPCDSNAYYGNCGGKKGVSISPPKYNNDYGCAQCLTDAVSPEVIYNSFSTRPKDFSLRVPVWKNGLNQAGRDYPIDLNATTGTGNPSDIIEIDNSTKSLGYSTTLEGYYPSEVIAVIGLEQNASLTCPDENNESQTITFVNGYSSSPINYHNVGKVKLTIMDQNWTSIDQNISTCIIDSNETNPVLDPLNLGRVGCMVKTEKSMIFVPDHFNVDANLSDHNNINNFTYLHDINRYDSDDNYSMGASLIVDIKAMGADNNITSNYMGTCYAKDTNLTLVLDSTNITYPGATPALTQFLYYNPVEDDGTIDSGEGNYSFPTPVTSPISIPSLPIENIASTFPADAPEGNGTSHIEYKLNFDRKIHLVVNPFRMDLSDVNMTDTDGVETTIVTFLDRNATFYYARSRASKFFYDDVNDSIANTPILIDVYCDLKSTACDNLDIDTVIGQINEIDWWLSLGHDKGNNDGNIRLREGAVREGVSTDWSVTPDVNIILNAIDKNINVSSGNATTLPLTVEIDLDTNTTNTNRWLIYNKETDDTIQAYPSPFYKVRFIGQNDWAGHGDTGHVVDSPTSYKKNRRLEW